MAALTSYNAAKILKLKDKGVIAEGYLADIAIIDPGFEYLYDKNLNKSKSQNSPLLGKTLKGAAVIRERKPLACVAVKNPSARALRLFGVRFSPKRSVEKGKI